MDGAMQCVVNEKTVERTVVVSTSRRIDSFDDDGHNNRTDAGAPEEESGTTSVFQNENSTDSNVYEKCETIYSSSSSSVRVYDHSCHEKVMSQDRKSSNTNSTHHVPRATGTKYLFRKQKGDSSWPAAQDGRGDDPRRDMKRISSSIGEKGPFGQRDTMPMKNAHGFAYAHDVEMLKEMILNQAQAGTGEIEKIFNEAAFEPGCVQ